MRICPKCGFTARGQTLGSHVKKCGVSAVDLFWSLADRSGECWVWRGFVDKWGYGHHAIATKRVQAHRHAYELTHGPIPAGKLIMHSCDNPPCVNPAHLSLGTDAENVADALAKGRRAVGEQLRHKLTEDQVRQIKAEYRSWREAGRRYSNTNALASRYVVVPATVIAAVKGRTWVHVK